jgi:predicted flap endonuclease-1-like 5' DNA nuclease/uncharacterized membrane-anchored protein YhcB (DUF1043 family)
MSIWVVLAFIVGLILGLLIAWFYLRRQVAEGEEEIRDLRAKLKSNETNLLDFKTRLQQQEANLGRTRNELTRSEQARHDLTAQLKDRDQTIRQLEGLVGERDVQIQDLTLRMQKVEAGNGGRPALFPEKERRLSSLTAEVKPPQPDDLQCIEGIGPKISAVLQTAGIVTFAQLAATDVSRLQQILENKHWTFADPATWPEQARLAAAGDWQALEALQDELKGGRRV